MGFNQVGLVGPRSEPAKHEKEKKSVMEQILEGLKIVGGVTDIAVDYQTIKKHMEDRERSAEAYEAEKRGFTTPQKQVEIEKTHMQVPKGTEGSIGLRVPGEGGQGEKEVFYALRPSTEKKAASRNVKENALGQLIDVDTGAIVDSNKKSEKPPKDISVSERNTLQNQYDRDPEVKKTKQVLDSWNTTQRLMKEQTPASDQALIYNYMKALDPGSVVRETEAETAAALGGLQEQAKAAYTKMTGGGMLTAEQRNDLANRIKDLAQAASERQGQIDEQFTGLAGRRGVDTQDLRFVARPKFDSEDDKTAAPSDFKGRREWSPVAKKWVKETSPNNFVIDSDQSGEPPSALSTKPMPSSTRSALMGN
jgi:hypothetical protein